MVLVVFWNSAMTRGLLQEPPSLNHIGHLADSRRHGDCRYRLPPHHCHPGAAATAAAEAATIAEAATVAADVCVDYQGQHGLFFLRALFLAHHVRKRGGFMLRMKALLVASTAVATSEGLWLSFGATPFPCFPLRYFANDSSPLISCPAFLLSCPGDMERCLGIRR